MAAELDAGAPEGEEIVPEEEQKEEAPEVSDHSLSILKVFPHGKKPIF